MIGLGVGVGGKRKGDGGGGEHSRLKVNRVTTAFFMTAATEQCDGNRKFDRWLVPSGTTGSKDQVSAYFLRMFRLLSQCEAAKMRRTAESNVPSQTAPP